MPEHSDPTPRRPIPPIVSIDPAVIKRLQDSLSATMTATAAPLLADVGAKLGASFAGLTSLPHISPSVLRPPLVSVVASNAALADRLASRIDAAVAPVAMNVASIANPRGLSLGAQVVLVLATVVSTVVAVLSFIIR